MICFLSVLEKLNDEYNVLKFTIVKLTNNNVYHCYYQKHCLIYAIYPIIAIFLMYYIYY